MSADVSPPARPPADADVPTIRLDQFLKLAGVAGTGGQAKVMIQGGEVSVDGVPETRRRRQLRPGNLVSVGEEEFEVSGSPV